jgi:CBS domain containing-hemolysin-like protein
MQAQGRRGAAALVGISDDPAPALSTVTLLRSIAEAAAAVAIAVACMQVAGTGWRGALLATLVTAVGFFIGVGVGPRTVGRQYADRVGLLAAPAVAGLNRVLGPVARLLVLIGNALTPGKGYRDGPFASEAELRELVDIAQERALIEAGERKMLHSVFEFGDTITREVMVPRPDLVVVERGKTLHSAMTLFLRSGFSRVPVVGDGVDDVLGILYLKDVARRLHLHPTVAAAEPVESLVRPAVFVPDSKPVDDLLHQMQRDTGHVAVVVDEYGGTAGLVTMEDILEEIVGEISDEYDLQEPEVEDLGEGRFRVPARLHVDEVGELFGLDLDDEEVDTVGGLLAKALGRVPIAGATATINGLSLTAERFAGRRHTLATVLVEAVPQPAGHDRHDRPDRHDRHERQQERRERERHEQPS